MKDSARNKRSVFDSPILSSKIRSANVKIFPEGGLGYFIGPTLALLSNAILSGYFNRYMTDILKINGWGDWGGWFVALLPLVSVVFVIIGNILVGRVMNKIGTRAGKARPLLLLSLPLSVAALLLLFVFSPLPDSSEGEITAAIFIAIGYNLWFAIAYPFYYTPHAALVSLSTRNGKDRSLLATISNATALASMGLTSMILPFFLGSLFVENGGTLDRAASYGHWKIFVIALMAITVVGVLVEYFFTRERVTEESFGSETVAENAAKEKVGSVSISEQMKICFKDKFWWIVMVFFFLYQLGGMMKNVSQLYFCAANFTPNNSTADGGYYQGIISIVGAVPTAVGMLLAWPLSNKIGKGRAILIGAVVSVVGGLIGFIAPTNFTVVVVSFVVKALGSTPAMYLSLALLADVLDHQEALRGKRTDSFSMTVYGAIMAGMTGLATGIMNIVLKGMNYEAIVESTAALRSAMTWIFIGGETVCYVLIALLFVFMNVEKFSEFDHAAIIFDGRAAAADEGREYISPEDKLRAEESAAKAASERAALEELKARCEKRGLDYAEEERKFKESLMASAAAEREKSARLEKKKEEAERAKAAFKEKKLAAMSERERKAYEEAERRAEERRRAAYEKTLGEFNAERKSSGKPPITSD